MEHIIDAALVERENAARAAFLRRDYETLGEQLDRRGIAIDAIRDKVAAFTVAVPSWGVGTGGTRFARFPGPGEPSGSGWRGRVRCRSMHPPASRSPGQ